MGAIGTFSIGSAGLPSTLLREPPVVTVTAPVGTITTSTTTVTWTYSSVLSRPQAKYRVTLRNLSGTLLYDSSFLSGTDLTHDVPFLLSGFTSYVVTVEADDLLEIGSGSETFFVQLSGVTDFEINTEVGSVWEVGINGNGFMLADNEGDARYRRQTVSLDPERFATGDTPFSEAVERYTFLTFGDWSGGAGQRFRSLSTSDDSQYWDSEGVNPFEPGRVSMIEQVIQDIADAYDGQRAVVASGLLFVATSTTEFTSIAAPQGAETTFTAQAAAGSGTWLASDGEYWYWSNGTDVRRNNVAVDPAGAWSTEDVTEIGWCGDRLFGFDNVASPAEVVEFSPAGVGTVRFTFVDGELKGLCGGDGYVWFGVNRGIGSEIRFSQLGSAVDDDAVALSLPLGETVDSLFFYLGNVFIATSVEDRTRLYRCVPSEGRLTPEVFLTQDFPGPVFWAGSDRFVAFSWNGMTEAGDSGIGVLDLSTGGYAKWYSGGAGELVGAVVRWEGFFGFTLEEVGFFSPATANPDDVTVVTSGFLQTSSDDLNSGFAKTFDTVGLVTQPLFGTSSVEVEASLNVHDTWIEIDTLSVAGASAGTFEFAQQGVQIALRFTFTADDTEAQGPVLEKATVKLHPVAQADQVLTLPVKCADSVVGLNGVEVPTSKLGRGQEDTRWLEGLVRQRALIQDIDWPISSEALVYDVVGCDVQATGVFSRAAGRRTDSYVVTLLLRRSL